MSCNPCAPKAIVTCLSEDLDKYLFYIHGLNEGQEYFWVLQDELGRRFSKAFTYADNPYTGFTLEILKTEVPDGLFESPRKLWFHIANEVAGESKVPFLYAAYVEQVQVEIVCDEFIDADNEIGVEVLY